VTTGEQIFQAIILFAVIRVMFLLAFVPALLLLRYVVRLEWNRAGLVAGILCAVGIAALSFVPTQTHVVRLDMPRPR
jgi:hypothetical protein